MRKTYGSVICSQKRVLCLAINRQSACFTFDHLELILQTNHLILKSQNHAKLQIYEFRPLLTVGFDVMAALIETNAFAFLVIWCSGNTECLFKLFTAREDIVAKIGIVNTCLNTNLLLLRINQKY